MSSGTIARVKANSGKFIMNVPVAKTILEKAEYRDQPEFTHTQYTAVTCSPEDYPKNYTLRVRKAERVIKVALVVTMYNESDDLFCKSMHAVAKNIAYLCSNECPFSWGKDGWKNFVVVIVSDGRKKINERVLTVLHTLGIYVPNIPRESIDGKPVTAHFFEYTTQISVDRKGVIHDRTSGMVPMQVIFCLKEKNAKKINSHKWFFNAVCESIYPEACFLLDVGTKPSETAFHELWRAFERNPMVGGACGEIRAEVGGWNLFNPLIAAQNFEYKMSNILDKPLESVFGYISVLPGAFSAYRYKALLGEPLRKYFLGEEPGADIFTSNLYLAEDRILCFELVTKKTEPWILKYVKKARAETDVPSDLPELVSQRRRWLNGSFFCSLYAQSHLSQIYASRHSFSRKVLFTIEFIYNGINIAFSWFQLANFYLAFKFLFDIRKGAEGAPGFNSKDLQKTDPFYPNGEAVYQALNSLYLFSMVCMLITALGNRPQGSRWLYYTISIFYAIIMGLMLFMGVWSIKLQIDEFNQSNVAKARNAQIFFEYIKSNQTFRDMVISTLSTYGLYLISSIIHLDPWHIFHSMVQYLFLLPTYINIFMIYSFCNLHDVSWGTKGALKDEPEKKAVAQKNEDGDSVYIIPNIPTDIDEANESWSNAVKQLKFNISNPQKDDAKRDVETKKEDGKKEFRSKVVLFWVFCNMMLIIVFTNELTLKALFPKHKGDINPYLTFLFWSVTALSLVRFLSSCAYLVEWWAENISDAAAASQSRSTA